MKSVCFGELLLRLSTPGHQRFEQAASLDLVFGGAEANVAVSLAMLGVQSRYVTRIPNNDLAHAGRNRLRSLGVDTSAILWGGERVGIYFLEHGHGHRGSSVIYDRKNSSFANLDPAEFDWKTILAGADWFHVTGISPAVSEAASEATLAGLKMARNLGIKTSCDLNFRAKLWSIERAREVLPGHLDQVDYLITNGEAAEGIFQLAVHARSHSKFDAEREIQVAEQMTKRFGFKGLAITQRDSGSASMNGWTGLYYTAGQAHLGRQYSVEIVDRVGGGDAFSAGLIYALGHDFEPQKAIEFALAAGCLKHSIEGDFNLVKLAEIEALASGGNARVAR